MKILSSQVKALAARCIGKQPKIKRKKTNKQKTYEQTNKQKTSLL